MNDLNIILVDLPSKNHNKLCAKWFSNYINFVMKFKQ